MLRGIWYVAMVGRWLKPRRMAGRQLLGEQILFGRRTDGSVFAVRDVCPHRCMPLRYGSFDGETVQCAYHGWRFGGDGRCVEIPSLSQDQSIALERIRCQVYPCVEKQGLIWIFIGECGQRADADPGEPPAIPDFADDVAPNASIRLLYHCTMENAAFGIFDPVHVAFVHNRWWIAKTARSLMPKEKRFEPFEQGWKTAVHAPPKKSLVHRLLGSDVKSEIRIQLPGLHMERIIGDRHRIVHLVTITPIDEDRTQFIQCVWWSMKRLGFLRPFIEHLSKQVFGQDADVLIRQREGLVGDPPQILMPDADTQMKWWSNLNDEWIAHRREDRAFDNPISPTTLRYRS